MQSNCRLCEQNKRAYVIPYLTQRECAGGVHIKERKDANLRAGLSTLLQESVHLAVEPVFSYVGCLARRQGRYSVGQLLLNLHSTTHTTLLTSTMPAKLSSLVPFLEITAGQVFLFARSKRLSPAAKVSMNYGTLQCDGQSCQNM
jgi:hypothetical protein